MQINKKIQPMMKRNINQYTVHRLSNDPKERFINKNITIFITVFHMFEKVEKGINVLSRDMEAIIKTQIKLLEMQNMIPEIKIHWVKLTAELQKN